MPIEDERLRSYILYLEPLHSSWLYHTCSEFLESSKKSIGINEAQQYHPHCSVTGFFRASTQASTEKIILAIDTAVEQAKVNIAIGEITMNQPSAQSPSPSKIINGVACNGREDFSCATVRIELDASGVCEIAISIQETLRGLGINIRPKPVDHISLAYIANFPIRRVGPGETFKVSTNRQGKLDDADCLATLYEPRRFLEAAIKEVKFQEMPIDWYLVLYEELFHSDELDTPHRFKPLKSWPLASSNAFNSR